MAVSISLSRESEKSRTYSGSPCGYGGFNIAVGAGIISAPTSVDEGSLDVAAACRLSCKASDRSKIEHGRRVRRQWWFPFALKFVGH